MPVAGLDPGINPGTRYTTISDYLSMTYSGTDGRIMSGHDGAGKAASVSMLTPVGISVESKGISLCLGRAIPRSRDRSTGHDEWQPGCFVSRTNYTD
jgi:hypothetical protein